MRRRALAAHCEGLIALTGGPTGPLDSALRYGPAPGSGAGAARHPQERASASQLYVEIQRHGLDEERAIEAELIALADRNGLPLVAANEPFFADARATTRRMTRCSPSRRAGVVSDDDRRRLSPEHDFKTRERDDGAVRRPAGRAAGERRDRHALRLRASTTRKPILPSFGTGPDAAAPRRGRRAAAPGRGGARPAPRGARHRAGPHRAGLSRPARLRARRSSRR